MNEAENQVLPEGQVLISEAANTDQLAGQMKRQGNELSAFGGLSPNCERSELRGDTDQLAGRRFIFAISNFQSYLRSTESSVFKAIFNETIFKRFHSLEH